MRVLVGSLVMCSLPLLQTVGQGWWGVHCAGTAPLQALWIVVTVHGGCAARVLLLVTVK